MKKKLILTLAILFATNLNLSYCEMINHTVYELPLSSSIKLKKIKENYGNSENIFNIIEADPHHL